MGFFKHIRAVERAAREMAARVSGCQVPASATGDGVAAGTHCTDNPDTDQQRARIRVVNGAAVRETIDRRDDAGEAVNDNRAVQLNLTVTVPGRDPYPATLTQVVSRLAGGNLQPRATAPVRVSPDRPHTLMIA
jgi:hypothetical protein